MDIVQPFVDIVLFCSTVFPRHFVLLLFPDADDKRNRLVVKNLLQIVGQISFFLFDEFLFEVIVGDDFKLADHYF